MILSRLYLQAPPSSPDSEVYTRINRNPVVRVYYNIVFFHIYFLFADREWYWSLL